MKIILHRIPIREVVDNYKDNAEEGVTAYRDRLDIRPKYQREFVYNGKQRDAVIDTVRRGFPLNVMYWVVKDDGNYEVLDGQQRTISIAQYVNGDFSVDGMYFHSLTKAEQDQILDYDLMIYFCEGSDRERLDWFRTINIAGEKLTDQELRNAVYTGTWLTDAKQKFSKSNCAAYLLAHDKGSLLSGSPIRQDYLEKVLDWISNRQIEEYMSKNQHLESADELWNYYQNVIAWVRSNFPDYRREMAAVEWGHLYNIYKEERYNPIELEAEVQKLMLDEDVTKKVGIYSYILSRDERYLSIRSFNDKEKREAYERQSGKCVVCGNNFTIEEMEADHITPWSLGGRTISTNCQMLCKADNRRKSNI